MAKLFGPDFIALQVRDLEVSARFYEEKLGLVRMRGGPPNAIVFETKPIPFALRAPVVDLDATSKLGWGMVLWMACDNPDELHEDLMKAAVEIVAPPADGPFGHFFSFVDPDGYRVTAHSARQ